MKNLKPALPKDEEQILEKGFLGNISEDKEYITDGHSLFRAADALQDRKYRKYKDYWGKKPTKESIEGCFYAASGRRNIPAHFIGLCNPFGINQILAVIRDDSHRIVVVDPYILQFAATSVDADSIQVDAGNDFLSSSIALYRDGKMVALVMPLRYKGADLNDYDLTGPEVPLKSPDSGLVEGENAPDSER